MSGTNLDVIIVGGGISGLIAASVFKRHGLRFLFNLKIH